MGRSWFTIDGSLEPIDLEEPSHYRFPLELARLVVEEHTSAGDWVLDPFCGFGTTLVAAQELGRPAVGIEIDEGRASFAGGRIALPSRVLHADATRLQAFPDDIPPFSLLFTSPPYVTLDLGEDPTGASYVNDLVSAFMALRSHLRPAGWVIVEMSNVTMPDRILPRAFEIGTALSRVFRFEGERIRCNTGPEPTGMGFEHSYLLRYRNLPPD